jgi:hypothetical protein
LSPLCRSLAVALALVGCVALPPPLGTESVTSAYAAGGGQWDDGATVIILVRAFEQDGRVAFCGVWTAHANSTRTLLYNGQVPGVAVLRLAGDRIHQGLGILPEARYRPDMTGATARCYLTDHPWRAAYAAAVPEIRIPRLQFDEGNDEGFGLGDTVVFRQTPVHRPLPDPAA